MLDKLIRLLLADRYLLLTCREEQQDITYAVYLLRLYQEKSLWLIESFDLDASRKRIIPVDQLTDVIPSPEPKRLSTKKFRRS